MLHTSLSPNSSLSRWRPFHRRHRLRRASCASATCSSARASSTRSIFEQAIDKRASDIHIEPYETFFRIRFRIDGRLYTVMTESREVLRAGGGEQSLLAVAANTNVVWMHEAAVGRALVGETTFEEVRRVLGEL